MSKDIREYLLNFKKSTAKLKEQAPNAISGFGAMYMKIMQDGPVPAKMKELIAVAIGVTIQCDPCIKLHIQRSLELGATREEVLDAASVGVMMGGGPARTYLPVVLETLDALQS
jgi:AhpD family alkylhydroperoxidase